MEVAREAVAEQGLDVSMRDIARRAEVGFATLLRHFPTREALFEGVVCTDLDTLTRKAAELEASGAPDTALVTWLGEWMGFAQSYKGVVTLMAAAHTDPASALYASCAAVHSASARLLSNAQAQGTARADMNGDDLFALMTALGWAVDQASFAPRAHNLIHLVTSAVVSEEGAAFLARSLGVAAGLREGADLPEAGLGSIRGVLRVTMPVLYGRRKVAPVLMRVADAHPELTIELDLRDQHVSLIEDGFDLAVRSGSIGRTAGLSSCVIGRHYTLLCAAPSLIERLGPPRTLDDLQRYDALTYHRDGWFERWAFPDKDGRLELLEPRSRLRAADLEVLLDAAISGRGVAWLPDWLIEDALGSGQLMQLLPELPMRRHDIHLLWATSAIVPARVQVALAALSKPSTLAVPADRGFEDRR